MGYVTAYGECIGCKKLFHFNPVRVPSISIEGRPREPVCADCVARVNPMRAKNGLPPIVPHPEAYGACEEGELG